MLGGLLRTNRLICAATNILALIDSDGHIGAFCAERCAVGPEVVFLVPRSGCLQAIGVVGRCVSLPT